MCLIIVFKMLVFRSNPSITTLTALDIVPMMFDIPNYGLVSQLLSWVDRHRTNLLNKWEKWNFAFLKTNKYPKDTFFL